MDTLRGGILTGYSVVFSKIGLDGNFEKSLKPALENQGSTQTGGRLDQKLFFKCAVLFKFEQHLSKVKGSTTMHEKKKIRTKDGRTISITSFPAADPNGKNIIIAPAVEVIQKEYEKFAIYFQQLGYNVTTFDYRGTGDSAPVLLKGFEARLQQWAVQDADAVIRFVRSAFPNQELIYIGHGIGGELIGLAQASQYVNKLVLVSSSLSCKKYWSWKGRVKITVLKTAGRLANKWFGYFPGKQFGFRYNLPKGVMKELADWCDNPNGLFDVFPENNYRKLEVPLFAFSFANDWMTPDKAVRTLLGYFSSASITWYHIQPTELGLSSKKNYCFFETQLESSTWIMLKQWLNEEKVAHQPLPIKNQDLQV